MSGSGPSAGSLPAPGSSLTAPGSINDVRTKAHLLLGQRVGAIDLTPLLLYTLSNSVPDSALPFLAWQFDLLSPWWQLIASVQGQRQFLANSVAFHRQLGTLAPIIAAMESLGFTGTTILEGQNSWGGTQWPSNKGWAVFRVYAPKVSGTPATYPASWDVVTDVDDLISIGPLTEGGNAVPAPVTEAVEAQAVGAITFFKPERCWLDSLWFVEPNITDALALSSSLTALGQEAPLEIREFVTAPAWPASDTFLSLPIYNAHFYYCGITYGGTQAALAEGPFVLNGTAIGLLT